MKKVKQIVVEDMTNLSNIDIDEIGKIDIVYDLVATKVNEAFNGEEHYRIVDVAMASEFARVAKIAGAEFIVGIAQQGAKQGKDFGKDFYRKAKHDFMHNIYEIGFNRVAFLMPAWVIREEGKNFGEFLYTFGGLKGVKASDMAKCLIWATQNQKEQRRLYEEKEIKKII